ncbi:Mechanosensitive ion channel-domain-containing protein [Crepidotus variabilis]|uniref:Mechanosensitive ion channel-domain-containing protein n=1 Tax=Crepidotus variabilis TaxID=179855 RepID=A0A9P6EGG2_9AGAR|nr:Mechanosensitive ion channel-domain-containing protein [Crepidotus variabilis]
MAKDRSKTATPPPALTLETDVAPDESFEHVKPRPLSDNFGQSPQDTDSDDTATNSSDEFNWSEEDEVTSSPSLRATRLRWLWMGFMKLAKPIRVLLVSALGTAILVTPLLVVNLRFRESPAKLQIHVWSLWLTIIWAAGCATFIVVDLVPRIIVNVTWLFGGHIERLKIQLELMMAVKAWLKLALDIAWAWIALSVIRTFYKPPGSYWSILNHVMQALFAAGIILFVEKLFLQFVAINFHQKALADRIAENQLGLKALDRLSNAQVAIAKRPNGKRGKKSPNASTQLDVPVVNKMDRFNKEATALTESVAARDGDDSTNKKSGLFSPKSSAQRRRRRKRKNVTSVIVDQVGEAIGQVALKDSKFNKHTDLTGLSSARKLARKLFSVLSVAEPPRSHLLVEDFYPYFRSTAEAHDAFALFDKDGNGDITKREMREAVQRIYRDRKALVSSLKDVDSIVAKLDAVLICVSLVIIIFICLLIFNPGNTIASLVPLATIILGFSFIFGHSAQTLFESLIFIFSTHVFDVGDLVLIDDQVLFVKEFGLFATAFRRVDGQEVIAPNSLLASTKLVHNLRRSKSMWETTNLVVSYNTPMEVIERLKAKIGTYMITNNREWSNFSLWIDKMEFQNAIHLIVAVEHRPNWQDWGGRWTRRNAFMRHLKTVLEELEIRYTMPVQPVILPRGDHTYSPRGPHSQHPNQGRRTVDDSMLGNAGYFQAGQSGRPAGVPTFSDREAKF